VAYRVEPHAEAPAWMKRNALANFLLVELARFRHGVATLVRPRRLTIEAVLCGAYLTTAGAAMYVLALGLGVSQLSWWQMLGIYAFSLASGLILPLPVDLGVVELSGAGAMAASGIGREGAISIMLLNRLLNVGSAIAIAAVGVLFLRGELHQALSRECRPPACRSRVRSELEPPGS
jgi:uncharacterized membrane protein YbhN (UPF0104 family)